MKISESQLGGVQYAWNQYCWGRMTAEEFAAFVAVTLALDNPSALPPQQERS